MFVAGFAAGARGSIDAYRLDASSGRLELMHRNAGVENVFFLALSPDQRYLFSIDVPGDFGTDPGYVIAWEILDGDGRLGRINRQSTHGIGPCHIGVDPSGRCLVVANYTTGSVASMPIAADGSLGELASSFRHDGADHLGGDGAASADHRATPHAHCAEVSPDGRFVFVCDLGLDQIRSYHLDAALATLSPTEQQYLSTPQGCGPRHFAFHPNGRNVYANNELACSVGVYDYDSVRGHISARQTISSLPREAGGDASTADIEITPDGSFLYCTNRLHDSIAAYRVADDGTLSLIEISLALGSTAQNLSMTDDGSMLICSNMDAFDDGHANLAVFRIDSASGKLMPVGAPVPAVNPACSVIVDSSRS